MTERTRGTKRTAGATKGIKRAGDSLALTLTRAQRSSERGLRSWVKSMERFGYSPDMPTTEMREIVETSFKSAEKVLKAQRAFALGVIDALDYKLAKKTTKPRASAPASKKPHVALAS